VAVVADEHDRVAVGGELLGLDMDLRHERTGGVDRRQPALSRLHVDGRRHAVGGEDRRRTRRDAPVDLVDEDRAAIAQLLDDVLVVDDLLAHVDRRAVQLERALDGLDRAIDAGAVAARRRKQQLFDLEGHIGSV
jgi:hypothetical protein